MDYEFWFWIIVAFYLGTINGQKRWLIYIGDDEQKYKRAVFGIHWRKTV